MRRQHRIDLVPGFDERRQGHAGLFLQPFEHLHHVARLLEICGARPVSHMHQKVSLQGLFKRCLKTVDQVCRQVRDETDRVDQRSFSERRQLQLADRRIEGRERHVLGEHVCAGETVEQGRLAGVRIADQRNDRRAGTAAAGALHGAGAFDFIQIAPQADDLVVQHPAVRLKLAFTWARQEAGATALTLKVGPRAHEARALIQDARQLDLQAALFRPCPEAEDFEDQPGPVDDLHAEAFLEVALLNRGQRAVDDSQRAVFGFKVRRHAIHDTAGQQEGGIDLADLVRPDKAEPATEGFNKARCLAQPVRCRTICRREPRDNHAGNFRRRQAINEFLGQSGLVSVHLFVEKLDRRARRNGRDRVLVDQLRRTPVTPEQYTEVVEPCDNAL